MSRRLILLAGPALVAGLTGCAGEQRELHRPLAIASEPQGATVHVSSGVSCLTPCTIDAVRSDYLELTFTKAGCVTQRQLLPPTMWGDRSLSAAASEIRPNAVFVALSCGS
jgi:hypothetical protein